MNTEGNGEENEILAVISVSLRLNTNIFWVRRDAYKGDSLVWSSWQSLVQLLREKWHEGTDEAESIFKMCSWTISKLAYTLSLFT